MDKCPIDKKKMMRVSADDQVFWRCGQHHFFNESGVQVNDPHDRHVKNRGQPIEQKAPEKKTRRKKTDEA